LNKSPKNRLIPRPPALEKFKGVILYLQKAILSLGDYVDR